MGTQGWVPDPEDGAQAKHTSHVVPTHPDIIIKKEMLSPLYTKEKVKLRDIQSLAPQLLSQ